jgi:hypothetical protein
MRRFWSMLLKKSPERVLGRKKCRAARSDSAPINAIKGSGYKL